jgi:hypothetical protein
VGDGCKLSSSLQGSVPVAAQHPPLVDPLSSLRERVPVTSRRPPSVYPLHDSPGLRSCQITIERLVIGLEWGSLSAGSCGTFTRIESYPPSGRLPVTILGVSSLRCLEVSLKSG